MIRTVVNRVCMVNFPFGIWFGIQDWGKKALRRCLLGGTPLFTVHAKITACKRLARKRPVFNNWITENEESMPIFKQVGFCMPFHNKSCFCHPRNYGTARKMQRKKQHDWFCYSSIVLGRVSFAYEGSWESHALLLLGLFPCKLLDLNHWTWFSYSSSLLSFQTHGILSLRWSLDLVIQLWCILQSNVV